MTGRRGEKPRGYEVTTYRIDGVYEDMRHPSSVTFTEELTEDLSRRDFTINAMAYDETEGLIDPFHGAQDLKAHIIRCVGDPASRFSEDALRILRAVRFAAQLNFTIDEATAKAAGELSANLSHISAERIRTELDKLLLSHHPECITKARELGITAVVLPELDELFDTPQHNPHHIYDVGRHTVEALINTRPEPVLRWAALLHDIAKPATRTTDEKGIDHFHGHDIQGAVLAEAIMRRLKWDNVMIKRVVNLVRHHDERYEPTPRNVRRAIHRLGAEDFPLSLELARADILAQSGYKREEKLGRLARIQDIYEEVMSSHDCLSLSDLAVNGSDLIAAGIAPGPELGRILNRLLDMCLDDPGLNDRQTLLGALDRIR